MNGKRAKKLRKAALLICHNVLKISGGEGMNEYNQAMNCTGWGQPKDKDGHPLLDGDGFPLMSIVHDLPGTVTTAWKWKIVYNSLKKEYKRKRMTHLGRPNTVVKKRTGSTDGRPGRKGIRVGKPKLSVPEVQGSNKKVETKV
jgi:hypothetical protein